jgi:hypothetical protein
VLESVSETKRDRAAYMRDWRKRQKASGRPRLVTPHKLTRQAAVRRYNALVLKFTRAMQGTRSALAVGEREMIHQAAGLMVRAEQIQASILDGDPICDDELIRVTSEMRRAIKALNLPKAHESAQDRGPLSLDVLQRLK